MAFNLIRRCLPDEKVITSPGKERRNGHDKQRLEPMWNSIRAGIVYQHVICVERPGRELQRNGAQKPFVKKVLDKWRKG